MILWYRQSRLCGCLVSGPGLQPGRNNSALLSSLILSEPAGARPEPCEGRRTKGESKDERAGFSACGFREYSRETRP